jgi:hypothetical protein
MTKIRHLIDTHQKKQPLVFSYCTELKNKYREEHGGLGFSPWISGGFLADDL